IDLHESPQDALLELDQNVQKKDDTNLESIPNSLKQMNDQINKENGDQQSQPNKEALEKFLIRNVFHSCTFNFGSL
ncbi:23285_t:CDS:1, partial [Gigaspora rosea]